MATLTVCDRCGATISRGSLHTVRIVPDRALRGTAHGGILGQNVYMEVCPRCADEIAHVARRKAR